MSWELVHVPTGWNVSGPQRNAWRKHGQNTTRLQCLLLLNQRWIMTMMTTRLRGVDVAGTPKLWYVEQSLYKGSLIWSCPVYMFIRVLCNMIYAEQVKWQWWVVFSSFFFVIVTSHVCIWVPFMSTPRATQYFIFSRFFAVFFPACKQHDSTIFHPSVFTGRVQDWIQEMH